MRELFRRMVFNILMDNTDDHEKDHALLVTDAASYELAPAYDVVPSIQGLGYQQLRVGVHAGDSTIENALSMCAQFGLTTSKVKEQLRRVAAVVAGWREHFARRHDKRHRAARRAHRRAFPARAARCVCDVRSLRSAGGPRRSRAHRSTPPDAGAERAPGAGQSRGATARAHSGAEFPRRCRWRAVDGAARRPR